MLPVFLNDLRSNHHKELVEITLELENDAVVLCNVAPAPSLAPNASPSSSGEGGGGAVVARSLSITSRIRRKFPWLRLSITSRIRRKFPWLRSVSSASSAESAAAAVAVEDPVATARNARKMRAKLERTRSSAQRALKGLRFISKSGEASEELWRKVEERFTLLAKDGLLAREDFGQCIGMEDSKEFAVCIFDALARRKERKVSSINREELHEFWLQISDQSFDARLQIFFDMADSNEDGRITREEVQELIMLSASANKLAKLKEQAEGYAALIMEELDPENLGYIELWQLEMLLLEKDRYMNYSRQLSSASVNWICRNTLTWLRSTRARKFVPFDDNINFHKMIAFAILVGVVVHAGNHLACDFPLLVNSSPEKFSIISSDFNDKKPTYKSLYISVEGMTGISMVILMIISFTLATHHFRRNAVKLPSPFNRLTGFNSFWYSHHLFGLVYVLLLIHGSFLHLTHRWYHKTTWMYISVPLLLYVAERTLRTRRSTHYTVKIMKVSRLPGNVFSLIMSKPNGFKYKSGQYIFLQCPKISPFEWHPFSITSAPGDEYLSVHIRIVGDWTQELKLLLTKEDERLPSLNCRATFGELMELDQTRQPRLLVDGPYGAPAQDYQNFDVMLLIGLGIGATPFISIIRDLLNNTRTTDELVVQESNTETSQTTRSDESSNSFTSSNLTPGGNKILRRTTNAYFYWVTREPGSFEWFKGVMDEVAEMDHKGQIELHNYLTSVYEEGDARSTLITMIQALNHAKTGVDILSGTRVRTHFARPNWREVFTKIASKHPFSTIGVFYCGMPMLAKELKKLSLELSHKTTTRFEFHKEYF
uniref:Respiratory burst oxidase isogeny protein F n=1 Tax=Cajanus cajan TaxID=3821 RepID=A0A151T587_CAJCA|nr:Respiratory burst oxidase isogeny protein F [Cajanus cajan]